METIEIQLNGQSRQVRAGLDVAALLEQLGLDRRMVVVERNREILPRERLPDVEVRSGDVLEVVHFVGGG